MDAAEDFDSTGEPNAPSRQDWEVAFRVLREQLSSREGCVSTVVLGRALRNNGIRDPHPLIVGLQLYDPESSRERDGVPEPDFSFRHLGRSFYSEERYTLEVKEQEEATAAFQSPGGGSPGYLR